MAHPTDRPTRSLNLALLAGITCGLFIRALLSAVSYGTNDVSTWHAFGRSVQREGLVAAYRADSRLNHPPLATYWAATALEISDRAGLDFGFIFRMPALLADAGACVLLSNLWRHRAERNGRPPPRARIVGSIAALAMALNPAAILVSAYHGNTDNIYAALSLLSVFFIADRRWPLAAGLTLGAAINVKLIPVMLIPALFAMCRDRRDAMRVFVGLALTAIPFAVALLVTGSTFVHNVLAYNSEANRWGLIYAARVLRNVPHMYTVGTAALYGYVAVGRFVVIGVALWLAWRARRDGLRDDPDRAYELAAMTMVALLVFAPGFGVQYTVAVVPLLLAVNLRAGTIYGLIAGAFLFAAYWTFRATVWPPRSRFEGMLPHEAAAVGVFAWGYLAWLFVRHIWASRRPLRQNLPTPTSR